MTPSKSNFPRKLQVERLGISHMGMSDIQFREKKTKNHGKLYKLFMVTVSGELSIWDIRILVDQSLHHTAEEANGVEISLHYSCTVLVAWLTHRAAPSAEPGD